LEQHKDDKDHTGAYARLLAHINPNDIGAWLREEVKRATERDDLMVALSRFIELQFLTASGIIPAPAVGVLQTLVGISLESMLSGNLKVSGVAIDPATNHEVEITGLGLGSPTFHPFIKKG
jgi:hypothetical protein